MHQPWQQLTIAQKNRKTMVPTPGPPKLIINEPSPTFLSPIIHNKNTMIMISLAQMRQSNGYGSIRNDDTFNLHFGSGAGP